MKKIYGLAALAAAMTLASCSNDNEPVVDGGATGETVTRYLAVNIMNDNMTKAPTEFDYGTDGENAVTSVKFVLFDKDGANGTVIDATPAFVKATEEGEIAASSEKVLLYNQVTTKPAMTQMLTIVNGADITLPSGDDLTLNNVRKVLGDYNEKTGDGQFVMTTAGLTSGYTTDVTSAIKDDVNDAMTAAVNVYVDRVVAKATVTNNLAEENNNAGATVTLNGEEKDVDIVVKGIALGNMATNTPLVKYLTGVATSWDGTYRNFWATTPVGTFDGVEDDDFKVGYDALTAWNTYTSTTITGAQYLHENTNQAQKPSVFVTAELQIDGEAIDLVRLMNGGKYYLADDGKMYLANTLIAQYGYKDGNNVVSYTKDDFEWVASDKGQSYAHLALTEEGAAKELYTYVNGTWTKADADAIAAFNTTLASNDYTCFKWTNGAALYYVALSDGTHDGIVRNHVYTVTLDGISGLGIPVFDPTETPLKLEEPDPDDIDDSKKWSLAATVNILKWAKVSQSVDFTQSF